MSVPASLASLIGDWVGIYRLWLTPDEPVRVSQTTATITLIARDQFLNIKYHWGEEGISQDGLLLVGYEAAKDLVKVVWVDSWHTGGTFIFSDGSLEGSGAISVMTSYAAPTGPDWGWRTAIEPGDGTTFRILMYNIPPGEKELLAVEARYEKSRSDKGE
jgi:Protein of unknown function (DUF1579)